MLVVARPAVADLPEVSDDSTFQDVPLATGLTAPTTVKFVPTALGNRMFVALKSGVVLAYDQPQDPNPIQVLDLSTEVHDFWDRGLLGMALSPGFNESGGTMYLLYARDAAIGGAAPRWGDTCPSPPGADENGCVISGKLVSVPIGALGSPSGPVRTIIQDQWCQQFPSHSVGAVAFGQDGMLYVSAGEGANFNAPDWGQYGYPSVNPCHDPYVPSDSDASEGGALRAQDVRTFSATDPTGLSGAIIRINPVTGAPDPSATGPDTNARRIVAFGMRNPFRFTFRPGTNDIWVGDVGWTQTEEIDEVTPGGAVENLGWPCYEGTGVNGPYAQQDLCASLSAAQVTIPSYTYDHGGDVDPGDNCVQSAGSVISGLAFYGDGSYPDHFNGGLFFTDYARNCIWFAPAGAGGEPDFADAEVFARGAPGVGPVDLQTTPNGNLVYVFHDQTFGEIHEIRPIDQPTARITVTDGTGPDFAFSAATSTPGGATYAWDLDNDNAFDDGTGVTANTHWTDRSARPIRLRVTANGITDVTSLRVSANNTVPHDARITKLGVPPLWAVGDKLRFSASAVDPDAADQGHLTYTWVLTILHCPGTSCHKHPVQSVTGPTATFVAPSHDYPSRLQVTLKATDTLAGHGRAAAARGDVHDAGQCAAVHGPAQRRARHVGVQDADRRHGGHGGDDVAAGGRRPDLLLRPLERRRHAHLAHRRAAHDVHADGDLPPQAGVAVHARH
jgi:glucose/arabinose dehydrogenase